MCCFVFFFFKQKTAYEMRISDWSSDVCSSDLLPPEGRSEPGAQQDLRDGNRCVGKGCQRKAEHRRQAGKRQGAEKEGVVDPAEIGRASCRASVCQYV